VLHLELNVIVDRIFKISLHCINIIIIRNYKFVARRRCAHYRSGDGGIKHL